MKLSQAVVICERAASCYKGVGRPAQEDVADQDWIAAAVVLLPKLRAAQATIFEGLDPEIPLDVERGIRRMNAFADYYED